MRWRRERTHVLMVCDGDVNVRLMAVATRAKVISVMLRCCVFVITVMLAMMM